ncbi:MAG TPA: nuclear transport factor 2 family protein [Longimicrobium sp.]|nr:nuclear transport factor 2 family protein [Longimicrobium sp.]
MSTTSSVDATEATREMGAEFFRRMGAREPEPIAALFADEVDWFIPGNQEVAPWVGRRHTRADVAEFYRMLFDAVTPLSVELQHLLVDGEVAIATGEFSSRMNRTGRVLDSLFSIDFTVRDGQIVRYRLMEDSHAVVLSLAP